MCDVAAADAAAADSAAAVAAAAAVFHAHICEIYRKSAQSLCPFAGPLYG